MNHESATKSILLTNVYMEGRSGSELHTLEMAKAFIAKGWKATVFCPTCAYPMKYELEQAGIRCVEFPNMHELDDHYDLLFAQHHLVSDLIWNLPDVTFDKAVVSILGPTVDHEAPPAFCQQASLLVVVSDECRSAVLKDLGKCDVPLFTFPNYATRDFFEIRRKLLYPRTPRKIAVVSNHTPQEVRQLTQYADIDFFGYETLSVPITPKLLREYDLVISIGRTAQPCFAMRMPFYCYDSFGGPGYIAPDEFDEHAALNFSGRSNPVMRSPSELWHDICDNYRDAVKKLDALRSKVMPFALDNLFDQLVDKIEACPPITDRRTSRAIYAKSLYALDSFVTRSAVDRGIAQLYYGAAGEPASEERSVFIAYRKGALVRFNPRQLLPEGMLLNRFDPDLGPCETLMRCDGLQPHNACGREGDWDVFETDDPIYVAVDTRACEGELCFAARRRTTPDT